MTKHSRRRRQRGVAMVEAGILAPIFAMMMMMTINLMGVYETKYRSCMLSRYATMSYASNHCTNNEFKPITNDLPPGIKAGSAASQGSQGTSVTDPQDQNGGTASNKYTSQAPNSQGAQAASSMFMGHGTSTLTWDYSPTYRFNQNGPKQITTTGQCVCNTPPPQGAIRLPHEHPRHGILERPHALPSLPPR